MAYEAKRDYSTDDEIAKEQKKAESDAANQKAVQVGAEVASNAGHPVVAAIGKGVKTADQASGGKVSELGGKVLTKANKIAPFAQGITNKLANSEAGDAAYKAYNAKNKKGAGAAEAAKEGAEKAKDAADQVKDAQGKKDLPNQVKKGKEGGESKESLPSSSDKNQPQQQEKGNETSSEDKNQNKKSEPEDNKKKDDDTGESSGKTAFSTKLVAISIFPILLFVLIFVAIFVSTVGVFSNFDDAIGISSMNGDETGGIVFNASSKEQKDFLNRVIEVENEFQMNGKSFNPLNIIAVYHAVNTYGNTLTYDNMNKSVIEEIANAMFENNSYSEEVFKNNLIKYFFPKYLPNGSTGTYQAAANEVFAYIERYYSFIGKEVPSSCTSTGSCTYNIKGFYINGRGNVKKEINVNDLYVRLMQCGKSSGHNYGGTYGKPLQGEELIPFEKYILGVAYAEIGNAPEHAFKAQMIAARSFILARPTDVGGWRTLKQENGKWVIQVASCTADQVYCDPDKGCSTVAGGNGQWYQVHSGTGYGRKLNDPIPEDSKLRKYAADVQGETLVNNQGNIVYTTYMAPESNTFTSLAKKGYDYKQILLQVYNKKFPKANVSDINKANCGNCISDGEYSTWRQNEGEWINVKLSPSEKTISQVGCLVTSISIQIAKSKVPTNISNFNPGTFVEYISKQGAFSEYGDLVNYNIVSTAAPTFRYQNSISLVGMNKTDKLNKIKEIVSQNGVYAVAEVMGNTGQHWVAIDSVDGDKINMMDPGTNKTNMWDTYNWNNTSRIVYFKVG